MSIKKNIFYLLIILFVVSCKKEKKDYVSFSGKITNKNSDSLVISGQTGYKKTISVDENGNFKDTLKVKADFYNLFDGKENTYLYLKNGSEFKITVDAKKFDETLTYKGEGVDESKVLSKILELQQGMMVNKENFKLSKDEFNGKIDDFFNEINSLLGNKKLDSNFVATANKNLKGLKPFFNQLYEQNSYISKNLAKGMLSPKFVNYKNYKGGTTSLDDLKGKYIYIDVWATWCPPCVREIPYMKKVEEKYHGKNIEFVSISIDSEKSYNKWKKMIEDKTMAGVQLFANGDKNFVEGYKITGIPRFILLDKEGKIIDANAPRPSSPELIEILNSLEI